MNTVQKIAGACFIGAFIGSLVALQLHHLWWIGLLVGAIVGYVVYEFKEIPAAAKYVWHHMPEREAVKKTLLEWKVKAFWTGAVLFIVILPPLCAIIGCLNVVWFIEGGGLSFDGHGFYLGVTIFMTAMSFVWYRGLSKYYEGDINCAVRLAVLPLIFSPGFTPILILLLGLAIIVGVCYGLYKLVLILWRLGYKTFRIVHSDMRLLCMTDAAIGTLIGFWSGNALVGGVAGAVCGVINYEIISVRWLKLAPQRS